MSASGGAVLVAGGAGYIGSHTAKQLHASGMRPVVLDNLITGNRFAVRFGPFIEGSIEDRDLVRRAIEEHDIRSVILFAAHAYVGESTVNPRKYYHNNVSAALAFLDALLEGGVRRHGKFSSSCSIYGIQEKIPISEESSKGPLSPYAETKLFYGAADPPCLRTHPKVCRSVCHALLQCGGRRSGWRIGGASRSGDSPDSAGDLRGDGPRVAVRVRDRLSDAGWNGYSRLHSRDRLLGAAHVAALK